MVQRIENRQQNEPQRACDGEEQRPDRARLVELPLVRDQLAGVSQPALGEEGQVEEDDCDGAAGDEERFEGDANVGDVPARTIRSETRSDGGGDVRTLSSAPAPCSCNGASRLRPTSPALLAASLVVVNGVRYSISNRCRRT
jgi:hypothetical protein